MRRLILGWFLRTDGEIDAETLLSSFGRLEAGLAVSVIGATVTGFWILRPDFVSSIGLYSTEDSLDSEVYDVEAEKVVLTFEASESARFRFRLGKGPCAGDCETSWVTSDSGSEFGSKMVYLGFLGPRLTPGRPRPSPLPETTVPSERVYCLTLRADVLGSRFGGGICGVDSSL